MKIGSLFSGYGGLDLAVTNVLDAEVVWHCEWEDAPSKVLEANFPGVPNYRDVSQVDWDSVEPVDILTGGFPCQDLSLAGKRAGLQAGTRSGLWSEFYKAITFLKPKIVIIENVRGLLSAKANSGMEYGPEIMEQANGGGLFFERLELFSATWPTSGMTQDGQALELVTQAHPTNGLGSSSLPTPTVSDQYTGNLSSSQQKPGSMHSVTLAQVFNKPDLFPTPTTRDYKDGSSEHVRNGQVQTDTVARAVFNSGEVKLFPTPNTMEHLPARTGEAREKQLYRGGSSSRRSSSGNLREDILELPGIPALKLFNTPTTMDAKATNNPEVAKKFLDQGKQTCLSYDIATNWGKFEAAIRRWESIIGRPAPEPTKPDGKDGNHRLSSKFTEWMMGLPEGWITGHGLKRNDELKLAGNGVVPQQAELALRILLNLPKEKNDV
jgi:DNA (cytosine-5)-methyltransferase 1